MEKKTTVPKSRQSLEPPIAGAAALRAACAKNLQVRPIFSSCWVCAICSNDDIMMIFGYTWIYLGLYGDMSDNGVPHFPRDEHSIFP
jgi:hypothetical protein